MKIVLCATAIAAAILQVRAESPDARKAECNQAGLVFATDLFGEALLVKGPSGSITTITLTDKTVITRVGTSSEDPARISVFAVHAGDLVCAYVEGSSKTAKRLAVVPRTEIAERQREFLTGWHRGSIYGNIQQLYLAKGLMVVAPVPPTVETKPVQVQLGSDVKLRTFSPTAASVTDATSFHAEDLHVGDRVYVWGNRPPGESSLPAQIVANNGFRAITGNILSISPMTSTVQIREFGTGRTLDVKLSASQLYRTAPAITSPTKISTPAGVPLVNLGFGDLQPGDVVVVLGKTEDQGSEAAGVILITQFGTFGVSPNDPSGQLTWILK